MPLYYSECCILCNRHLHLTEQSLILAVAVMFSLHVYLQIDVRTCIYWSYVRYYVNKTVVYRLVYLPMGDIYYRVGE